MKKSKKTFAVMIVATLALAATPITAFAHGCGQRGVAVSTVNAVSLTNTTNSARNVNTTAYTHSYELCGVENCNIASTHLHDGVYYYGHSLYDGHNYHELCGYGGCSIGVTHMHDGDTFFGHHYNDGHGHSNSGWQYSRHCAF